MKKMMLAPVAAIVSAVLSGQVQAAQCVVTDPEAAKYPAYTDGQVYAKAGEKVNHNGLVWSSKWWIQNQAPSQCGDAWQLESQGVELPWSDCAVYLGGQEVNHDGRRWKAKYWTRGNTPSAQAQEWTDIGEASCGVDPIDPPVDPEDPSIGLPPQIDPIPVDPVEPPVDPEDPSIGLPPQIDPIEPPVDPIDPPVDPEDPSIGLPPQIDPIPVDPVEPPVDPEDPSIGLPPQIDPIPVDPVEPPVDPEDPSIGLPPQIDPIPVDPVEPPVDPEDPSIGLPPQIDPIPVDPIDPPVDPEDPSIGLPPQIDPIEPPVDPVEPPPVEPPPVDPGLSCDPTQIYREDGRECMGDDHQRRIIGYFTSWRNGENGLPTYLVKDIPWDKVTHINYAFAGLNANTIELTIDSSATEQTWEGVPGAEMDPSLPYKGHFNLLNKYKKQYPDVKTLISVGGWAETGGFYSGTTLPNCQVNHAGIEKIADQSVAFIRKYGFDGVDYDYEYPTSMTDAGNPVDWPLSNLCRGNLFPNYVELMRVTREKLDQAGEEDGRKYMLTIASPSSAYLLRGMEAFQITDYLDYVNLMTYDFHGTWNHFAGHNAALFDNKTDAELHHWGQYSAPQFGGIGSLNVAWAGHYFRGAMPAGKINIGVPYYTRGWQNVQGGTYGLNGTAPSSEPCPIGTGMSLPCGDGPKGINNLWFDVDDKGEEIGAGVMPIWHAKNLEHAASLGITTMPSYGPAWGLDPNNPEHVIHGTYDRHFDDKAKVPWLWNAEKKLFLSTEDEESIKHKIDYVNARGYGGLMIWELAGDYGFDQQKNEYYMGDTLTTQMYEGFKNAKPYDIEHNDLPAPDAQLDITLSLGDFDIGDSNFPITPKLTLTNNSTHTIPGGTRVELLMPTSTSDQIADWSGFGVKMVASGGNNNSDGILVSQEKDFHKIGFTLPGWQALNPGASIAVELVYHLPITGLTKGARLILENGTVVGLKSEYPNLPEADLK